MILYPHNKFSFIERKYLKNILTQSLCFDCFMLLKDDKILMINDVYERSLKES